MFFSKPPHSNDDDYIYQQKSIPFNFPPDMTVISQSDAKTQGSLNSQGQASFKPLQVQNQEYAQTLTPSPIPSKSPAPISGKPNATTSEPYDMEEMARAPQTISDPIYMPGFLKSQIGNKVRVEFLIGTNAPMVDRTGTLKYVGANYIIIAPENTDDLLMCDLYSIKFVTILR